MSWKFKASKYKNAAPKVPKPDEWIKDINVGSYTVNGQIVKASASFMAFNADVAGSNLYILPLNDSGRKPKDCPLLHAHSDLVSDLDFSPFDDGLLATGSQDSTIKLWHIPEGGLKEPLSNPQCVFSRPLQKRVESVVFHPAADFLLSTASGCSVTLWDVLHQKELSNFEKHEDVVQSVSWKLDGTVYTTSCRDRKLRVVDPRAGNVAQSVESHSSNRESIANWLGDSNRILTSGFDSNRQRQVYVRDVRKFSEVEFSLIFDSSTGLLLPLYDADTSMLFLAGKADNTIGFYEVNDRNPVLTEGLRHTGQQTKGACLVPKRAMKVMEGEVNRILQLTAGAVIPISYIVPRKSYREFHADIYPDTAGVEPAVYASQWIKGVNGTVSKISLDPSKTQESTLKVNRGPLSERKEEPKPVKATPKASAESSKNVFKFSTPETQVPVPKPRFQRNSVTEEPTGVSLKPADNKPTVAPKPLPRLNSQESSNVDGPRPVAVRRSVSLRHAAADEETLKSQTNDNEENDDVLMNTPTTAQRRQMFQARINSVQDSNNENNSAAAPSPIPKRATRVFGRVLKYRHLQGTTLPRGANIDNLRGLDNALPAECNGFHANPERVAVPLNGPGGRIAVLELSRTGRLPDGPLPALFNTCKVLDFSWDPFNNKRLAVGCEDGRVRIWDIKVESGSLMESSNEPSKILEVPQSTDRITIVQYHPLAANVLATVSADYVVRVWSLDDEEQNPLRLELEPHSDQIFSIAWSPCGKFIASVSKDGQIRVFESRVSPAPVRRGNGPNGVKGARVLWALGGKMLLVSGFDKSSQRLVHVFKADDLSAPLNTLSLDVSPTLLIPFYDEDSSTLFLTGKGDTTFQCYEVSEDSPHFHPLTPHKNSSPHQGVALLPKWVCQVKDVEFARFVYLTSSSVETLTFTVPRVKSEYFQDDLFPATRLLWEPCMNSEEWFAGKNVAPQKVDLKPNNMETLSSAKELQAATSTPASKPDSVAKTPVAPSTGFMVALNARKEREKGAQLEAAISAQLEVNLDLEQDRMEGVDESEWD